MIRCTTLTGVLLATLVGCGSAPRPQPQAVDRVPAALHRTWRGGEGEFLLLGTDRAVINLRGVAPAVCLVTGVTHIGGGILLTLDNGWTLSLAPGRGIQVRQHGGIEVAADCPVLDLGLAGPKTPASMRLIDDGAATWLPIDSRASAGAPPQIDPAEVGFLTAIAAIRDHDLTQSALRLVGLAHTGVAANELDAACAETVRQRRLAALEIWQQAGGPDDPCIADGDCMLTNAQAFAQAYQLWR